MTMLDCLCGITLTLFIGFVVFVGLWLATDDDGVGE